MGARAGDEEAVKVHFLTNLKDQTFRKIAVTNGWSLFETVEAASRAEAIKDDEMKPPSVGISQVGVDNRRSSGGWFGQSRGSSFRGRSSGGSRQQSGQKWRCEKCARERHGPTGCPAKNATCRSCGKVGHFYRVCRSKPANTSSKDVSANQVTDNTYM
jgi:hypothetical protein